jgi:hypothetical protein
MEVLEYVKDDPIAEYATLKIRSGVDNKFFDYNIKNMEDQQMLEDLLDKTSKSFFDLEKAFVSFLETGKATFKISKTRVDWVNESGKTTHTTKMMKGRSNVQGGKVAEAVIECKIDFPIGDSYLGFYRMANNEINAIKNYIKTAKIYSSGIQTKFCKGAIEDSIDHLKNVIEDLENSLAKKDEKLDQVYNDFKTQLIGVFLQAVSVRSNGLINVETLRDRITANLTNVTTGEVKDGFYSKLDQARQNFINMNKEIIDSLLNTSTTENVSNIDDEKTFFEEGTEQLHDNLRNTIIVNEHNESFVKEEPLEAKGEMEEVDPKEFFNSKAGPLNDLAKKMEDENLDLEEG